MFPKSWFKSMKTASNVQQGTVRRSTRLSLESLEDRIVLDAGLGMQWNGGPMLSNVEIVPVFYGQDFYTAEGLSLVDTPAQGVVEQYTQFLQYLVGSSFMDLLSEYSVDPPTPPPPAPPPGVLGHVVGVVQDFISGPPVPPEPILLGKGTVDSPVVVADSNAPADGATVTDAQIQAMIGQEVQSGNIKTDANTLVVVFTPQGVSVQGLYSGTPTEYGYHGATANGLIPYAVIAYPPNMSGNQAFNQITEVTSHEVAEAVTDPQPGGGWNAANPQVVDPSLQNTSTNVNGEIGDLVENDPNHACILGGYTVTGLFSLEQYNANNQTGDGLKYPAGATPGGSSLALSDGAFTPSAATSYPALTTSSSVALNPYSQLQVTSTTNPDGSISGTFSGQYDGSSTSSRSGSETITDQQGAGLYTLSYAIDVSTGQVTGSFDITPAGVALGYGPPNAPLVSTPNGLTATSTNNSGSNPTFSGILATFADTGGQGDTATINWGDGTTSNGTIIADPTFPGKYDVVGTHTFAAGQIGDTHTVNVSINGANGTSTFQTTITNAIAPLDATTGSVQVQAGTAITNAALGTFVDTGGADATSSYTATIDWGDGSQSSQGTVSFDGQKFIVQGSHTYSQYGIYTLNITVQDADGSQVSIASTATVNPIGTTVTLTPSTSASSFGQPVNFQVTVQSANSGVPTGSVTLLDGQTVVGTANLNGTGNAMFTVSNLAIGQHTLTATYSGDNLYHDGISPAVSLTVSQAVSPPPSPSPSPSPSPVSQPIPFFQAVITLFIDGAEEILHGDSAAIENSIATNMPYAVFAGINIGEFAVLAGELAVQNALNGNNS
jgi:hypothetical protein